MAKKAIVSIVMGSDSDLDTMKETVYLLREFGIFAEVKISSAHRTPKDTAKFAEEAEKKE